MVSVLEGLGALPLNWSYKAMPRSSRSELVCDGLRLPENEGRLTSVGWVGRRPVGNPVGISHLLRLIGVSGR